MKTLVIGATGIIGNHVVRALLDRGHEVRALQRGVTPALNLEGLDIESLKGDATVLADLTRALKGCDWVFHTAPYYPTNTFGLEKHCARGVGAIETFLKALKQSSVKRCVYTSTLTTIGASKDPSKPADETCAYDLAGRDPHPYFAVKHRMEESVRRAAQEEGLPCVIVNPTGCFGPYELKPPNLCLVPQLVSGKIPAYVSRPINLVDVADVGVGQVLAAEKGRIGERYILGGVNTKTDWAIQTVCRLAGVKAPRVCVPLALALIPSYLTEVLGALTNQTPRLPLLGLRFTQYGQHLSSQKAIKELNYQPHPLEPCLERSIEWFRRIGYC